MATKPPPQVQEFEAGSLEKIAYTAVSEIPTQEPNDRNRLGYHVWRWLKSREGSLTEAIAESGARLQVSKVDAEETIVEALAKAGVSF